MDIAFTVHLPVDARSVPLVRGLCRRALEHLRVRRTVVEDISLALTEACVGVVQHAGRSAGYSGEYEVQVVIDDTLCRISVLGDGVDAETSRPRDGRPSLADDHRRLLMRALVDRLDVRRESDGRQRLTMEKRLSPRRRLRLVDPV